MPLEYKIRPLRIFHDIRKKKYYIIVKNKRVYFTPRIRKAIKLILNKYKKISRVRLPSKIDLKAYISKLNEKFKDLIHQQILTLLLKKEKEEIKKDIKMPVETTQLELYKKPLLKKIIIPETYLFDYVIKKKEGKPTYIKIYDKSKKRTTIIHNEELYKKYFNDLYKKKKQEFKEGLSRFKSQLLRLKDIKQQIDEAKNVAFDEIINEKFKNSLLEEKKILEEHISEIAEEQAEDEKYLKSIPFHRDKIADEIKELLSEMSQKQPELIKIEEEHGGNIGLGLTNLQIEKIMKPFTLFLGCISYENLNEMLNRIFKNNLKYSSFIVNINQH